MKQFEPPEVDDNASRVGNIAGFQRGEYDGSLRIPKVHSSRAAPILPSGVKSPTVKNALTIPPILPIKGIKKPKI